jgi:hypothetical protein
MGVAINGFPFSYWKEGEPNTRIPALTTFSVDSEDLSGVGFLYDEDENLVFKETLTGTEFLLETGTDDPFVVPVSIINTTSGRKQAGYTYELEIKDNDVPSEISLVAGTGTSLNGNKLEGEFVDETDATHTFSISIDPENFLCQLGDPRFVPTENTITAGTEEVILFERTQEVQTKCKRVTTGLIVDVLARSDTGTTNDTQNIKLQGVVVRLDDNYSPKSSNTFLNGNELDFDGDITSTVNTSSGWYMTGFGLRGMSKNTKLRFFSGGYAYKFSDDQEVYNYVTLIAGVPAGVQRIGEAPYVSSGLFLFDTENSKIVSLGPKYTKIQNSIEINIYDDIVLPKGVLIEDDRYFFLYGDHFQYELTKYSYGVQASPYQDTFNNMFTSVDRYVVRLDKQDNYSQTVSQPITPNGNVDAAAEDADVFYMGGSFTQMNATGRNGLAAVTKGAHAVSSWTANISGEVQKIFVDETNDVVYVLGSFDEVSLGTKTLTNINGFALNSHGTWDGGTVENNLRDWAPNTDHPIYDMIIDPNNSNLVYLCGNFQTIDGESRYKVALYNNADNYVGSNDVKVGDPFNSTFLDQRCKFIDYLSSENKFICSLGVFNPNRYEKLFNVYQRMNYPVLRNFKTTQSFVGTTSSYYCNILPTVASRPISWYGKDDLTLAEIKNNYQSFRDYNILVDTDISSYIEDISGNIHLAGNMTRSSVIPIPEEIVESNIFRTDELKSYVEIGHRFENPGIVEGTNSNVNAMVTAEVSGVSGTENFIFAVGEFFDENEVQSKAVVRTINEYATRIYFCSDLDGKVAYDALLVDDELWIAHEDGIRIANPEDGSTISGRTIAVVGGGVNRMALYGNYVYVTGSFTTIAGTARTGVASIHKDTLTTGNWRLEGIDSAAPGNNVKALYVDSNAAYIGGEFSDFTLGGADTDRTNIFAISNEDDWDNGTLANNILSWDPSNENGDFPVIHSIINDPKGSNVYVGGVEFLRRVEDATTSGAWKQWNPFRGYTFRDNDASVMRSLYYDEAKETIWSSFGRIDTDSQATKLLKFRDFFDLDNDSQVNAIVKDLDGFIHIGGSMTLTKNPGQVTVRLPLRHSQICRGEYKNVVVKKVIPAQPRTTYTSFSLVPPNTPKDIENFLDVQIPLRMTRTVELQSVGSGKFGKTVKDMNLNIRITPLIDITGE